MKRILVIFQKEVMDNLRDRRSISTVIFGALFTPLILVMMIMLLGNVLNADSIETPLRLPVAGAENAPSLVQFLEQNGAEIVPAPADPQAEVREGNLDVVLIIPEGYGEKFSSAHPAEVQLVMDSSRMSSSASIQRARGLLYSYSTQIGSQRLLARGVNPMITSSLLIERVDMATPQSQSLIFLNMLPFFLIMSIFTGGMYVIIDATAGERERGSLEPLLINPARRSEFVLGKLAASLPFALATLVISLTAIGMAFNFIPLEQYTGFPMTISLSALWTIFWLCLPIILLASGLQTIIATYTRSFKEAQTYLSFLPIVAGLPGMFLAFMNVKAATTLMLVPVFGQSVLINQIMRGETIAFQNVAISIAVTLVAAVAAVLVSIRLYQRERILFSTK
ncbi:MAG: ABC transporter permease [Anaerolineaceae bacterium]